MKTHLFSAFGTSYKKAVGVVLSRVVFFEPCSSLGRIGTELHMDDGSEVMVNETVDQVQQVLNAQEVSNEPVSQA